MAPLPWLPCPLCALCSLASRARKYRDNNQNWRYRCGHCGFRFSADKAATASALDFLATGDAAAKEAVPVLWPT